MRRAASAAEASVVERRSWSTPAPGIRHGPTRAAPRATHPRTGSSRPFALALAASHRGHARRTRTIARVAPGPAASIAVLPFADLSPGKDNAYFSDGITDELINTLTHVDGFTSPRARRRSRTRDSRSDVREVGRRLGVATVLEGSVRKAGEKLRITVQLANAADGYQLWSESYDREMTDVFAIQEDISREIVTSCVGRLVPAPPVRDRRAIDADPDAYDLYLKGQYAWHQRTETGLRRAAEYFQQAAAARARLRPRICRTRATRTRCSASMTTWRRVTLSARGGSGRDERSQSTRRSPRPTRR